MKGPDKNGSAENPSYVVVLREGPTTWRLAVRQKAPDQVGLEFTEAENSRLPRTMEYLQKV